MRHQQQIDPKHNKSIAPPTRRGINIPDIPEMHLQTSPPSKSPLSLVLSLVRSPRVSMYLHKGAYLNKRAKQNKKKRRRRRKRKRFKKQKKTSVPLYFFCVQVGTDKTKAKQSKRHTYKSDVNTAEW
jgi:hypothetical protein